MYELGLIRRASPRLSCYPAITVASLGRRAFTDTPFCRTFPSPFISSLYIYITIANIQLFITNIYNFLSNDIDNKFLIPTGTLALSSAR